MDKSGNVSEPVNIDDLKQIVQDTLTSFSEDPNLSKHKYTVERLYVTLQRSNENEKRLFRSLRDLSSEMSVNAARVNQAQRMSEEDATTIEDLKKEVDRTWSLVEQGNAKQDQLQAQIEQLTTQLNMATSELDKHRTLIGDEQTLEDIIHSRNNFRVKIRELETALSNETEKCESLQKKLSHKNDILKTRKDELKDKEKQLTMKALDEEKEIKKRNALESDLKKLRESLEQKILEKKELEDKVADLTDTRSRLSSQLDHQRSVAASALNEVNSLQKQRSSLEEREVAKTAVVERQQRDIQSLTSELQLSREAVALAERENARLHSQVSHTEKLRSESESELVQVRLDMGLLQDQLRQLQQQLSVESGHVRAVERRAAHADREKAKLERTAVQERQNADNARAQAEIIRTEQLQLEQATRRFDVELARMNSALSSLEREREQQRKKIQELETERSGFDETLHLRDAQVQEMERRELELLGRLKTSSTQLEELRVAKAVVAKGLTSAQSEIAELRRKIRVLTNQIEQLKDDVTAKDRALVAEQFESAALVKKVRQRTNEGEQLKRLLIDAGKHAASQESKVSELSLAITRLDSDALAQRRVLSTVVTERDVVASQLTRRNDELTQLGERLAARETAVSKGGELLSEQQATMRILLLKLAEQQRTIERLADQSKKISVQEGSSMALAELGRRLIEAQGTIKALSDELSVPRVVHRWRELGADDLAAIEKCHVLRKRVVALTERLMAAEKALEAEKRESALLRKELDSIDPQLRAEKIGHLQDALAETVREVKSLSSEANAGKSQLSLLKDNEDRLKDEIRTLKLRIIAMKKEIKDLKKGDSNRNSSHNSTSTKKKPRDNNLDSTAISFSDTKVGSD